MAAATLSSASATPTGKREATLAVSSNQATGTVYVVVTASSTTPSHAQIVAGTDENDAAALYASSKAGALSNSFSATIERVNSSLWAHFTQKNAGNENSTPVKSAQFWLHGISLCNLTENATTSVVTMAYPYIRISGDDGTGTLTVYYRGGDGTWVAVKDAAFTTADQKVIQFHRPADIKATLSGATNPTLVVEVR